MTLVLVGLSHRTAALAAREKAALTEDAARAVLADLSRNDAVAEAVVLSTCNRTELYGVGRDGARVEAALRDAVFAHTALADVAGDVCLSCARDGTAARHLLCVAAGLESMVIGESEIQGQVRGAADRAATAGTLGPELRALFRRALVTGKRVRRRTGIACGPASVASVAADLARRTFGDLDGRGVLLVGAGRSAEAVAAALARRGMTRLVVANRTPASAARVARRFGGRGVALEAIGRELASAEVLVSSTDAPVPLVSRALVERAMRGRGSRSLLVLDLAVPRDVEPAAGEVPGVRLYDLDDLDAVVRATLARRREDVGAAEQIVGEELGRLTGVARAPSRRAPMGRPAALGLEPSG